MKRKYTSILYIAQRNLFRRSFRTIAITTSLGVVVTFLVFSLSVNAKVKGSIERIINRLGGDVMIVPAGAMTSAQQFLIESKRSTFYMEREIFDKIRALEPIDKIIYHIYLSTMYGVCCGVSAAQIIAFNPENDFVVSSWIKETLKKELQRGEVIVGSTAYEEWQLLFRIEDAALILGKNFKIAGVLESTGTVFDNTILMREDDVMEIMEKGLAAKKIDTNKISVIFVKLKKGYDPESTARLIEERFLEVDAVARGEIGRGLRNTLSDLNKVFFITVSLTTALSLLMISAFFTAIINERMREIGILRSLGAKRIHLFGIFLSEAIIIGVMGSVLGAFLGNVLSYLFSGRLLMVANPSMSLDLLTSFKITSVSFSVGPIICIIGALYSIVRISRMEPYRAIRKGE